jgi:prepilin peptidase CpaA
MLSDTALLLMVLAVVPLMLIITWYDLRFMRIPNWTVLAVFGAFIAIGSWGLPFDTFLWRLGYGAVTLMAAFALYSIAGLYIGAGDLKLLAALAPLLSANNLVGFIGVYVLLSILGLIVFLMIRRRLKGRKTSWAAFNQRAFFPAGVLLGLSMATTLLFEAGDRLLA